MRPVLRAIESAKAKPVVPITLKELSKAKLLSLGQQRILNCYLDLFGNGLIFQSKLKDVLQRMESGE